MAKFSFFVQTAENKSIGVIILAAGVSRRMMEPKQLIEFRGKTLLRRATETALESVGDGTIVVLGANFEKTRAEIEDLPIEMVHNEDWESGMSSSILAGIEKLKEKLPFAAALVMLADQPFITANHLNQFAEKFRDPTCEATVIAAEYDGTLGVPALFSPAVFDDLLKLSGDEGAKKVLVKYRPLIGTVNLPEAAFDIDTPADLGFLISDFGL